MDGTKKVIKFTFLEGLIVRVGWFAVDFGHSVLGFIVNKHNKGGYYNRYDWRRQNRRVMELVMSKED